MQRDADDDRQGLRALGELRESWAQVAATA